MKKVVVIGGGFAGSYISRKLQNYFKVILIDSKDYFEFTPGILRTIVEPAHIKKIQILHKKYLNKAKVIIGDVKEISEKSVTVGKKMFKFDYAVICSGSNYQSPIKEQHVVIAARSQHLINCYKNLSSAKEILIIGGGLVGVELAAEICTHYPRKKVVIVHLHDRLMERQNIKTSKIALNFLKKHGVTVHFKEKIIKSSGRPFVSSRGKIFKSDMAFLCTGITPNYHFLKKHFSHVLNKKNQVIVNKNLQVKDYNNIFSAGDITSVSIEKTAQNAEKQAKTVVKNIKALEKGFPISVYNSAKTPIVLSLGKFNGIFEFRNIIFSGVIPSILKKAIELREMWRLRLSKII